MTNYYHKKGNRITKYALLNLIADIMKAKAVAKFRWLDEGFESLKDMIHFSSAGHKCILLGVGCPNVDEGKITLVVMTEWEGKKDSWVDVTLDMSDIHINTLEKIACEVYDSLWNPEVDDGYDIVRDDYVSGYLDTYLSR